MSLTIPHRYTLPAIVLHWLIAILIIANILIVWTVDYFPKDWERPAINLHKSFGLTVLGLAILRLLWRLTHTPPAYPIVYAAWEKRLAHAWHWALYAVIFLMPISGWLHDSAWEKAKDFPLRLYGVIPWFRISAVQGYDLSTQKYLHELFGQIHTSIAYVIYAMVAVHVGGALKHQFMDRQPELQRMLP